MLRSTVLWSRRRPLWQYHFLLLAFLQHQLLPVVVAAAAIVGLSSLADESIVLRIAAVAGEYFNPPKPAAARTAAFGNEEGGNSGSDIGDECRAISCKEGPVGWKASGYDGDVGLDVGPKKSLGFTF